MDLPFFLAFLDLGLITRRQAQHVQTTTCAFSQDLIIIRFADLNAFGTSSRMCLLSGASSKLCTFGSEQIASTCLNQTLLQVVNLRHHHCHCVHFLFDLWSALHFSTMFLSSFQLGSNSVWNRWQSIKEMRFHSMCIRYVLCHMHSCAATHLSASVFRSCVERWKSI